MDALRATTPDSLGQSSASPPVPELWARQAARVLEVDPRTLAAWTKAGKITARRTATGRIMYLASDVEALAESLRRERSA